MPIYSVQAPDGKIYDVEAPEGASERDITRLPRKKRRRSKKALVQALERRGAADYN